MKLVKVRCNSNIYNQRITTLTRQTTQEMVPEIELNSDTPFNIIRNTNHACDQLGFSIIPLLIPVNSDAKFLFALGILTKLLSQKFQSNRSSNEWNHHNMNIRQILITISWTIRNALEISWIYERPSDLNFDTWLWDVYTIRFDRQSWLRTTKAMPTHCWMNYIRSEMLLNIYIWLSLQRIGISFKFQSIGIQGKVSFFKGDANQVEAMTLKMSYD